MSRQTLDENIAICDKSDNYLLKFSHHIQDTCWQVRSVAMRHLWCSLYHPSHPHHCGKLQQVFIKGGRENFPAQYFHALF